MRIKKILFLLTILQVFGLNAQEFDWANSVTGGDHEHGVKAIRNSLGETYLIGYSTGNPFVYEGNEYYTNGRSDAFFIKLDSQKNLVWLKIIGGDDGIYNDMAVNIHIDPFGDIYLAIQSVGQNFEYDGQILSGVEAPGQTGGEGVIIKVNSDGEYIWHESGTTLGGDNNSFVGLTTDSDGNLYIVGLFRRSVTLGGTITLTNPSTGTTMDMLVAKYQPDGNIIWAKRAGGIPHNTFASGQDIKIHPQTNEVIVLGHSDGPVYYDGEISPAYNGNDDEGIILLSYNPDGTQNWVKQILELPSNFSSYGISLDISSVGVIGICGYKNGGVGLVGFYNSDGSVITEHEHPAPDGVRIFSISFNEYNKAYLSGWSNSGAVIGIAPSTVTISSNTGFIVKLDEFQQVKWASEFTASHFQNSISYGYGKLMYAGRIDDDFTYNNGQNIITPDRGDALFAEMTDATLSTESFSDDLIVLYPNPTKDVLRVKGKTIENIEIYNVRGVLLKTTIKKEIDFTSYARGVYFIKVKNTKGTVTKKVILI